MSFATSAAELQLDFITIYCSLSAGTLLAYEYLITFDREYRLIWKRRFSAATLLFFPARYSLLLNVILTFPNIFPLSTTACSALSWLRAASQLLFSFHVVAFSSLRAYALSGRQWQVASVVFILSLVSFGIEVFEVVRQVAAVTPPPINCTSVSFVRPELWSILMSVRHVTAITAEILVLAVTVHQAYWQRRASAAEANLGRTPLHTMILRDGTIYFLALLVVNIGEFVSIYAGDAYQLTAYVGFFNDPITAITISRFMLNLREVDASKYDTEDPSRSSFVRSIQFAAFVEPLGASLDHEFSFSAIDLGSLDEQEADGESGYEDVLGDDEEMASGQTSIHGPAEAGPSRIRQ